MDLLNYRYNKTILFNLILEGGDNNIRDRGGPVGAIGARGSPAGSGGRDGQSGGWDADEGYGAGREQ